MLTSEDELDQVKKYQTDAGGQHEEAVSQIENYLRERKDDPPSVASRQSSHTAVSGKSSAAQVADIEAKVKQLELEQLQKRLETEEEQQQIQRKIKLQEAEDAHAAAELRAQLARAAEDNLNWERRDDFVGESRVQCSAEPRQLVHDPVGEPRVQCSAEPRQLVHDPGPGGQGGAGGQEFSCPSQSEQ